MGSNSMKLLARAVIAYVVWIMLLLPVNLKTMSPPPPMMGRGPGGPPQMPHGPGGPPQISHASGMMPPEMMHGAPQMPHGHSPQIPMGRPGMENRPGIPQSGKQMPHEAEDTPTHVVSGVDTNFRQQESIDHAVDTINAKSGGNWLLKRVWWEKTEEIYEQIKEVFNRVMDTRMRFISDYNKLNRSLDIFYSEVGIEQGPLRDLLSHAQDLMDKEAKEQGYLNKKEQAFVFKLKGKERDLEQLKLDVKAIQELDAKLDEAFEMLFKQIDVCNQYEQKAWDNFKEIARELNDKEARKLYYDTEGLYKDIKKVSEYISGAFTTYFDQTIQSAHDYTSKISSQMNALKNEGIDLVKQAEILEKDEEPAPKKPAKKVKQTTQSKGWWYKLGEHVGKFIDMVISWIPKSVRVWFGKEEKKADAKYDKLKKEVDADLAPVEKEIDKAEKWAEPDVKSVEKVGGELEKSGQADMKLVEKEAKKIEESVFGELTDAQKKELGIDETAKHKPHVTMKHSEHVQHQPMQGLPPMPHVMPSHALPTPPTPDMHHAAPSMPHMPSQPRQKKDHAVEHMSHRPLHIPGPRRSITDHFTPPSMPLHMSKKTPMKPQERHPSAMPHGPSHPPAPAMPEMQHVPSRMEHRPQQPQHDSEKINALHPGTLG